MDMWRRSRADRDTEKIDGPDISLATECEAFLTGRYADHLQALRKVVPDWAWLNALAHGTDADLRALAAEEARWPSPRSRTAREWQHAIAFLAAHLAGLVATGEHTLAELQIATLAPIELDLAALDGWVPATPAQVVSTVLAALHHHPSGRR
jgi:hypothetical protein